MKEPTSYFHHKRPPKIKLIISFNGIFHLRHHSAKLRYVGGETRIVTVDHTIGILQLVSKISQLCPNVPSFSIKYQLRHSSQASSSSGRDTQQPLITIATDEDVRCMIDEYDRLQLHANHARLWVFVCTNGYDGFHYHDSSFSLSSFVFRNSNFDDLVVLHPTSTHVGRFQNCDDPVKKNGLESLALGTHALESQNYDNPFEESVYAIQNPSGAHTTIDYNKTPNTHLPETGKNLANLVPLPDFQLDYGVHNYKTPNTLLPEKANFDSVVIPSVKNLLNEGGGGGDAGFFNQLGAITQSTKLVDDYNALLALSDNQDWGDTEHILFGNLSVENVRPCTSSSKTDQICVAPDSCNSKLVGTTPPGDFVTSNRSKLQCRFRNQRIGSVDIRNQRITSYCMHNHRSNLVEIGTHYNIGLDGKTYPGKCYPGLKASTSILKHGQLMRSHYTHLWKPWTSGNEPARDGKGRMVETTQPSCHNFCKEISTEQETERSTPRYSVDDITRQSDHLAAEFDKPNAHATSLGRQGVCLPSPVTKNPFSSITELNTPEEISNNSNHTKRMPIAEPVVGNLLGAWGGCYSTPVHEKSVDPDPKRKTSSMGLQKTGEISGFFMDTNCKAMDKLECNSVRSLLNQMVQPDITGAVKSLSNDHNGVCTLSGALTPLMNLSLCNLSLASGEEASSAASSSLTSNDVSKSSSRCEMEFQPNPPDIMDEGHFGSGPPIENLSMDNSSSSFKCASGSGKNLSTSKDNQRSLPPSLVVNEKANGNSASAKVLSGISGDLAKFYSHLPTRELQTIKSSDLEDIKEVGSGTYGTVFFGKWKGSDVAIKRIKPSCFSGDELEEDRLISDFWKEAHILAQLHHPNVVSFYGVVTDGPVTNLATVTEYMVNGSLKQVLQRKDRTIDRRKRLILAMDAAFGMEYLHEKNIVHFDLKSHNFLVNMRDPQRPVCKIGDMGLSKVKQRTLVSGGVRGTIPWMAPELLTTKKPMVTEKVDVYSFGIVMWELLTGEEPYAHLCPEETIAGIINGDLRPEVPSWCDPAWRSLMERCWLSDPTSRPSFSEIAKELRVMAAAMNIK